MTDRELHIGDRCRIRQWDDMAAEFKVEGGAIMCDKRPHGVIFAQEMKPLCGKEFTISSIDHPDYYDDSSFPTRYYSAEGVECMAGRRWTIIASMLEPIESPSFEAADITSLIDCLMNQGGII